MPRVPLNAFVLRATQEPVDDGRRIEDPRLRRMLTLWHAAGPNPMPALLETDALAGLGEILTIVDVERPGPRFRYRRCATPIVERLGMDLTGTHVDQHPDPASRERIGSLFEAMVREPRPYHTVMVRMLGRGLWATESLALPLFGPDGAVIAIVSGQVLPADALGALAPAEPAAQGTLAGPLAGTWATPTMTPSVSYLSPAAAAVAAPPPRGAPVPFVQRSVHDPVRSTDQLDDPRLRDLLTLWEHEGPRPGLMMIDPITLRFLLGNIVVFVVEPEPLRFRYRLFGTNIARRIGHDMTGRHVHDLPDPATRRSVHEFLEKIWRDRRAYRALSNRLIKDEMWLTEALGLPLFDDAGTIVAILAGQVHTPAAAGWTAESTATRASG